MVYAMRQRNLQSSTVSIRRNIMHNTKASDQIKRQCKVVLGPLRVGTGLRNTDIITEDAAAARGAMRTRSSPKNETHFDNRTIRQRQHAQQEASRWASAANASAMGRCRRMPNPLRSPSRR